MKMPVARCLSALTLMLAVSACDDVDERGVDPGDGVGADGMSGPEAGAGTDDVADAGPDDPTFFSVRSTLDEATQRQAELTREGCFADYVRLRSLLGTPTSVERFHAPGEAAVDVEWIEPGTPGVDTDGPVGTRQGTGAILDGRRDPDGRTRCVVSPYETYGFAGAAGEGDGARPATLARIDAAALACAPESAHPDVLTENLPLLVVEEEGTAYPYGSIGRRYVLERTGAETFETVSVRRVSRRTDADGAVRYVAECGEPATLPNGDSVLDAPAIVVPIEPFEGPTAFVGRPWQATARAAQEAVDARGVLRLRGEVERAAAELGMAEGLSNVACPDGGTASLSLTSDIGREERRHAFAACVLDDGTRLDGFHDTVLRDEDGVDSVRREREERFALRIDASGRAAAGGLEAVGELTEALSGRPADGCGLLRQEHVLRLDVSTMRTDGITVTALAIEDITNTRTRPAADGGCAEQLTEHAFSDSARVVETLASGTPFGFSVNRTGSIVFDSAGVASASGSDASIRIYAPESDDSLDIVPDFSRPEGATVTIDEHPGRSRFAATWRFVER